MPVYFPPKASNQTYTVSNVTPTRTYDPTTALATNTAQTLATLIQDLKAAGLVQ